MRYLKVLEKHTIQFDNDGKPLYSWESYIKYITGTANRNYNIFVSDQEAGTVVDVTQEGKLRWRFTGHPSRANRNPFKPRYRQYCIDIISPMSKTKTVITLRRYLRYPTYLKL